MSQDIRRELIGRNLGIKPINHGQIYAFQIAIPDSRKAMLSLERRQALEKSLLAHQSNLTSLIVRRTDAYEDEEIEYELVYGADWLQVAQDLDIEKVWAWVFDMTDEEAIAIATEMEWLFNSSPGGGTVPSPSSSPSEPIHGTESINLEALLDQKLQLVADSIKSSLAASLNPFKTEFEEKIKLLNYRLDSLTQSDSPANVATELSQLIEKIDALQVSGRSPRRGQLTEFTGEKINLLHASDAEIRTGLQQVRTQDRQIEGAIRAIHYWRQSAQGLTWQNLQRSAGAKRGSAIKIEGFAEGTCDRLQIVAEIPTRD